MLNITENNQSVQVNISELEKYFIASPLQNNTTHLNHWEKRKILKAELAKQRYNISLSVFIVGTYLIDNCNNETMKSFHSIARISKDTYIPIRTVKFALARLRKINFIKTRQQNRINGQWGTNEIWLNCSLLTVGNLDCPQTTIIRKEVSINTSQSEISKSSYSEFPTNSKTIILSLDWHPNRRTIDNIERILGFDYTRRESERRSFIIHLFKQQRQEYQDYELNALYYCFCRTSKQRQESFKARGKIYMSMELRRNLAVQKLYAEPINDMPAPDIPVENRISDSQAECLQKLLIAKTRIKPPPNTNWKIEAAKQLRKQLSYEGLNAEQIAILESNSS